jgi:predicted fused transcriptional regulator/phosphomethylpyrimidine kinase
VTLSTLAIPKYKKYINVLKKQGYKIIGYTRKSEAENNRERFLHLITESLKKRSGCDVLLEL